MGKAAKKTASAAVRLDPELKAALQRIADDEDRTLSYIIAKACAEFVERAGRPSR